MNKCILTILLFGGLAVPLDAAAAHAAVNGTYECNQGRRENTLYVKELPGHKIKFAMSSTWNGNASTGFVNTGQAGGVTRLTGNIATYKEQNMTLRFAFNGNRCRVSCEGLNYYGGVHVDPNGSYVRVSARIPTEKELALP
jgi:hypothetical protein